LRERFPEILHEIRGVIGHDAMLQLVNAVGGTRVYIPASAENDHWLITTIGPVLAKKLCEHFTVDGRGNRIEIPLLTKSAHQRSAQAINARIDRLMAQGKSTREIAMKVGISQRTIHRRRSIHRRRNGHSRQP
jgi:DNA-binding NarL/FixJ family response regulator